MSRFLMPFLLSALLCCGATHRAALDLPCSGKNNCCNSRPSWGRIFSYLGKPLLFHGINVVNKSKDQGYTENITSADFARIRSWGMNAVRLCIFWDGLEPRPGHFDQAYLERIATLVEYAKQQGLYALSHARGSI